MKSENDIPVFLSVWCPICKESTTLSQGTKIDSIHIYGSNLTIKVCHKTCGESFSVVIESKIHTFIEGEPIHVK